MGAIIIFKSVTYAQKSQYVLEKMGILCSVSKVSGKFGMGSCAHGIKLNEQYLPQAINIIRSKNIPFVGAYKIEQGGYRQVQV